MEALTDYQLQFVKEMEELRQLKAKTFLDTQQRLRVKELLDKENAPKAVPTIDNEIQSAQYSGEDWRKDLMSTFYRTEHGQRQFELVKDLNPEVYKKKFNMRVTQISEYSNAKYNNTVFTNPKHSSC